MTATTSLTQKNDDNQSLKKHLNLTNTYQNRSERLILREYKQKKPMYQKQYCYTNLNAMQSNENTNTENIIITRKPIEADFELDSVKVFCDKNKLLRIDQMCDSNGKNVCNCSEKNVNHGRNMIMATIPSTKQKQIQSHHSLSTIRKNKYCNNKTPKPKTQNTFLSRLLLTDIIDTI